MNALLRVLQCPDCRGELARLTSRELHCVQCGRLAAIQNGVIRIVRDEDLGNDSAARLTRASFGYEWSHFDDWRPSGQANCDDYFADFALASLREKLVLDAGCGMGRHARHVATYAGTLIAVDFSSAIDAAARNVADHANVQCLQADVTRLPLASNTFDFVYSMGVLHHIEDTAGTLTGLVRVLRPGGRLRVYLYWKRTGLVGALLGGVALARRVTVRLPFSVLRVFCWILSVFLTAFLLTPYRILGRCGFAVTSTWPLSAYVKYPFTVLYNDQFDRFSAPIEKRYTEDEVRALMKTAGLRDVRVHPMFGWLADGVK